MSGKIFFDQHKGQGDKCKHLQKLTSQQLEAWEKEVCSEHSPGIVDDAEELFQQIVDPTHFDLASKTLKPVAFDDSANKGLSVNRIKYSTKEALIEKGMLRAQEFNEKNPERPKRSLWGFVKFETSIVRNIISQSNSRAFFVYDTANESDISHADICQGISGGRQIERSLRSHLYDLAKECLLPLEALTNETTT